MKKKLLAIFLTVAMIVALLPTIAFASATGAISIDYQSMDMYLAGGTYQIAGESAQVIPDIMPREIDPKGETVTFNFTPPKNSNYPAQDKKLIVYLDNIKQNIQGDTLEVPYDSAGHFIRVFWSEFEESYNNMVAGETGEFLLNLSTNLQTTVTTGTVNASSPYGQSTKYCITPNSNSVVLAFNEEPSSIEILTNIPPITLDKNNTIAKSSDQDMIVYDPATKTLTFNTDIGDLASYVSENAGDTYFLSVYAMKNGGGEHGGEEKQTSITGIVLDPITLNKEYDGYYITADVNGYADPNSFRYVVNTQTIKMTLSYMKEGQSKPDSKHGTYEDIKKQVPGLPMQFSLKDPGSDDEKYLNSDVKTGDKLSLKYATVSGRPPQENDYRLIDNENNSVEITIEDGDSKLTAVKRFLDNITSTGKLYINSVKFTDDKDIKAAVDAYLDSLDNKPTGVIFETTVTNGKVTITAKQDAFGNYPKLYDVKDIEVAFSGPLNDKAVSQVDKAIKKIKTVQSIHPDKKYNVYQENFYTVEDLDLFNYYESTRNGMIGGTDRLANMINFSREFREDVLDNTNIKAYLTSCVDSRPEDGASSDGLYVGKLVLAYDGCVYAIVDNVGVVSARVFYISSKIDSTSYLAFAQEIENRLAKHKFNRIIEPGSPGETAISYLNMRKQQHTQNPNETPETIAPITDIKGKETEDKLTTAENKYYIMDHAVRYNIVIDDTKAEYYSNLAVESIDVETKASVKVDITAVPLDMNLKVEKLKKGDDAHDANMKKFDLEEGITYDFELSSTATGSSITKAVYMDKNQKEQYDVFTVTMPVTKEYYDKFKAGAEVMAYNDKDTKGHPVTDIVKKGDQYLAIFETTHFSAYTIAAGAVNPKTGNQDNAMLWIFAALGALILTSGVFAYTRKKSNR